jgi:hypothetical protein
MASVYRPLWSRGALLTKRRNAHDMTWSASSSLHNRNLPYRTVASSSSVSSIRTTCRRPPYSTDSRGSDPTSLPPLRNREPTTDGPAPQDAPRAHRPRPPRGAQRSTRRPPPALAGRMCRHPHRSSRGPPWRTGSLESSRIAWKGTGDPDD